MRSCFFTLVEIERGEVWRDDTDLMHARRNGQLAHVVAVQVAVLVCNSEVEGLHGVPCDCIVPGLQAQTVGWFNHPLP